MIADTDIAWAAGILDGEGSIGAYTNGNGGRVLSVQVGNTDFRMVQKLHDMFGGCLRETNPCASGRTYWQWKTTSRVAASCLRLVLPYLITKKEQAEVALVFSDTRGSTAREELALRLRDMKKAVTR
jgi:hypothetical protein